MRDPGRLGLLLALFLVAGVGCGRGTPAASTSPRGDTSPGPRSSGVPNPFTVTARWSASSLGLNEPAALAIGPDGRLFVTDASQRVTVISPLGKVLARWGRRGNGPGEFDFVRHEPAAPQVAGPIAVGSDGSVYVADTGNGRIEIFSSAGGFIRQFGAFGSAEGRFLFPEYVAVDHHGNLYVSDTQQQTVSKFSPSGAFVWRIGGASERDRDLVGHFHITVVDAHDRLVAANDDRKRIVYIDANGHKVDAFGSPGEFRDGACNVSVDAAGDTFVTSCEEPLASPHYTEVFDRTHELIGAWYPSPIGWSPAFGPNGEAFALGDDGSILKLELALRRA